MRTSTPLIAVNIRNVFVGIAAALALTMCLPASAAPARDGFTPDLGDVAGLPLYSTNSAAVAKALQSRSDKSQPLQYGVAAALPLQMADGVWTSPDAATAVWRLRVTSSGARSLSLQLANFQMPDGGALYLYDKDGRIVQGPYSAENNSATGQLWTAMVQSDEAILEVRVPSAQRDQLKLSVVGVTHGFVDPFAAVASGGTAKSLSGDPAGSCEVNVAAPPGSNWGSEIRSVGAYTVQSSSGGIVCSGQLINDIPQDGKPFFLTAYHCGVSSAAAAASVVVYWNYQSPSACGSDTGNLMTQNQSGSTLVAGDVNADFTLLQLAQTPNSAYNVYSAGFDASGTGASNGVSIHHPSGDIKKISNFNAAVTQQTVGFDATGNIPARNVRAWQVSWFSGVTEEGSSGSGLWNQNRQLIGVLSGGNSSCSMPTGNDYYARLDIAWTANTSSSGQLKANLDPNNTGVRSVGGRNANGSAGPTSTVPPLGAPFSCSTSPQVSGKGGAFAPMLLLLMAPLAAWRSRRRQRR